MVHYDDEGGTFADMISGMRDLGLDVALLVVTTAGLGTLNSTALTAEALRSRGLRPHGLVFGSWPAAPDLAARSNLADLPVVADAPTLPEGSGTADCHRFLATASSPPHGAAWQPSSAAPGRPPRTWLVRAGRYTDWCGWGSALRACSVLG
ncbi:ATP-dependent dethiobiotin synthetase BioD [Nonomuraea africana]|uniref:ATP-dependent dethiobiotin synthetase BioD n=1 Tax=Nonomuraea africana TaxID=46171 RepID=UPI003CD07D72